MIDAACIASVYLSQQRCRCLLNQFVLSRTLLFLFRYRDGKRCAQTLKNLFDSASNPDRVYVGLIEQTNTEDPKDDPTCLDEYCSLMGYRMKEHPPGYIHKGEKQADHDAVMEACPRVKDQIRSVRFHHIGAKGPVYARSFIRKILGNERVYATL